MLERKAWLVRSDILLFDLGVSPELIRLRELDIIFVIINRCGSMSGADGVLWGTKLDSVTRHGATQLLMWSAFYYQLPALLPHMTADGLSLSGISGAVTAAILVWAVLIPVAGRLVDHGHGVAMMRIGGAMGVALLILMTAVPYAALPLVIVALGVPMAATLYDPCFAILLRTAGLDASRAITTVTLVAGLATLLSFPLVMLIATVWPWQGVMLVFAGIAALGVASVPGQANEQVPVLAAPASPAKPPHRTRLDVALIAVPFGLAMFTHAALLFLLPLALLKVSSDNSWALYLPAILGPAQIAGRLLWRRLAPRSQPKSAANAMFALLLLPPLILLVVQSHWLGVLLALLVQGGLYGIHTVLRPLIAASVLPLSSLGQTLGAIATIGLLMMAAAPALGGVVMQNLGYQGLITSLLAVNLAALGFAVFGQFESHGRARWTQS
jgi:hypothetical protein